MKRIIIVAVAAVAMALSVAACGGSSTPAKTTKAASVSQSDTGYFNMTTLGNAIGQQAEQRSDADGDPAVITVTCIRTGAQTAECNGQGSDGSYASVKASISADGNEYITDGGNS